MSAGKNIGRSSTWDRFYEVVFRIPAGKVASYGQVAGLAGLPGYARQVGYALNANPHGAELPWWRVLNARASYGQVAGLAGLPGYARQVGYALNANPHGAELPWWRVLNARGEISLTSADGGKGEQMERLAAEGVEVDHRGRVDLRVYGWEPTADTTDNGAAADATDNGVTADATDNGAAADTTDNGVTADNTDLHG